MKDLIFILSVVHSESDVSFVFQLFLMLQQECLQIFGTMCKRVFHYQQRSV